MNFQHKIGQLFCLGFQGDTITASHPVVADITRRNLGGVILFDRFLAGKQAHNNITSASQLKDLTTALQGFAPTPLLIGIDQEGGRVRRLKPEAGFPATASAAELGRHNDRVLTAIHAATTAATLKAVGIQMNFAPVVDINSFTDNPVIGKLDRSFSPSPGTATIHAREWIMAHTRQGVLSCLKHFPGHGSSRSDSHQGFTDISETWSPDELQPYHDLIAEDLADAVMVGHLFHRQLDPEHPATLSPRIIGDLLRRDLRFSGLVLSDDMQMKAITDQYGMEEAACLALAAGVDMIIIGNNLHADPMILSRLLPAIELAVQNGRLPAQRIHEAYDRVQLLKRKIFPALGQ